MGVPIVLVDRVAVAANTETNIIPSRKGTTLTARSMVTWYLNRQAVGLTFSGFVGSESIFERAGAPVDATLGQTPSFQDDRVISTFGNGGDLIILNANNTTGAPLEAGFIIQIAEVDDAFLAQAMEQAALAGLVL